MFFRVDTRNPSAPPRPKASARHYCSARTIQVATTQQALMIHPAHRHTATPHARRLLASVYTRTHARTRNKLRLTSDALHDALHEHCLAATSTTITKPSTHRRPKQPSWQYDSSAPEPRMPIRMPSQAHANTRRCLPRRLDAFRNGPCTTRSKHPGNQRVLQPLTIDLYNNTHSTCPIDHRRERSPSQTALTFMNPNAAKIQRSRDPTEASLLHCTCTMRQDITGNLRTGWYDSPTHTIAFQHTLQ